MKLNLILASAALVAAVAASSAASATALNFDFTGTDGSTLDFVLDSNPTPSTFDAGNDTQFHVAGSEDGVLSSDVGQGLTFWTIDNDGGFQTFDNNINTAGIQLYTGSEAAPVFAPMTVDLLGYGGGSAGTLVISNATVSAAPEPGTWALMFGGLAMIGGMLRIANARRGENEVAAIATA